MPLRDFFVILRRRWLSIAALTVVCMVAVGVLTFRETPQYRASAQVYFTLPYGNTAGDLSQGSTFTQSQVLTYAEMVKLPIVLDPVAEDVGHRLSPSDIGGKVSASVTPNTVIVTVSATDASPKLAARIANSAADHLGAAARDLAPKSTAGTSTVDARTVGRATPPKLPFSPRKTRNVALAMLGGLFLGIAIAVLRDLLDIRIKGRGDIEEITDAPLLGEITNDRNLARRRVVLRDSPAGVQAEAFRRVQTNLAFIGVDGKPVAAVITSSLAMEGKSSIAVNLALACAEAGLKTLLVDGDLRSPSVAYYMGLEGTSGLSNVLVGQADLEEVVQQYDADLPLDVLTSGPVPPNAGRLLGSASMSALLNDMRAAYDVVLIDSAPLLPVTDAAVLARQVSGAILVARTTGSRRPVRRRGTSRHQLAEAVQSLEQADADVLGVVLNGLPQKQIAYYGYGDDPERRGERPSPKGRRRAGLRRNRHVSPPAADDSSDDDAKAEGKDPGEHRTQRRGTGSRATAPKGATGSTPHRPPAAKARQGTPTSRGRK